jgi:hypothetical protein|tara:strand:- start:2295 stop:2513 length:219 start_codon:yes stop_codon:yes gene_type:complete
MHTLMDIYNNQYQKKDPNSLVVEVPQIDSLLKHLDLLYSIVLKKQMEQEEMQDTITYFNPGQGSKSQADSVN